MSKATIQKPAVFRFKARLIAHPEAGKSGSWGLLEIPGAHSKVLAGMTRLEGTINGQPFRAPLEAGEGGKLLLRVNEAMRRGADAGVGESVELAVLGPEPPPAVPADLRAPLADSAEATALWQRLDDEVRRDWIRWIELARKPETRARRVQRTVEQLAEGKRRPCCVNHYEFMLCSIQETEEQEG